MNWKHQRIDFVDWVFSISCSASLCACVCNIPRTDLVEAAPGHGLQQLIGFLGLMASHDACRLCRQGLATHQHHHIYRFLEEDYLRVLILERKKMLWWTGECTGEIRNRMRLWKQRNSNGKYFPTQFRMIKPVRYAYPCRGQHKLLLTCLNSTLSASVVIQLSQYLVLSWHPIFLTPLLSSPADLNQHIIFYIVICKSWK